MVGGLRRARGFAYPGLPYELQPAPAPSRSQESSLRVTGSLALPKFSISSVGAEGGGQEQSLSAGAVSPGSRTGLGEQKSDKWDADLKDLPRGSGRQRPARIGPC